MEVIDLTLDSPPPKDGASDDKSARKKEERRKRRKEKGETSEERKREKREATRERDSHRSSRREHDRDADDRKRRRESSREHDPDTKRARHHSDRKRERDPDPPVPDNALFYVDETPTALPAAARYTSATAEESPALILPPHVSVFGETPAAILPAEPLDSDEDDYIEYLDYDNRKVSLPLVFSVNVSTVYRTSFATTRRNLKKGVPKSFAKSAGQRGNTQRRNALSLLSVFFSAMRPKQSSYVLVHDVRRAR
jgi:protein AIR1/2